MSNNSLNKALKKGDKALSRVTTALFFFQRFEFTGGQRTKGWARTENLEAELVLELLTAMGLMGEK